MSENLWRLDAGAITTGIRNRQFTTREVVTDCLERIDATNSVVNALTEIRPDEALAAAERKDKAIAEDNELGALHGVPVTIKGNVDLEGWATVNGCAALLDNIAPANSPCVQNWLNAGVIVMGRTNTPEFSCRWETSNEVYGATRNPWDPDRTPGGSSGGAAASIAVGITPLAHGTDLGGSLRQPAQACGIASIRPGRGCVPDWNPTDTAEPGIGFQIMNANGLMARKVSDLRLGLQAMAHHDWHDPWSVSVSITDAKPDGRIVALVIDPAGGGVNEQVADGVQRAGKLLSNAGYQVEEIEPPGIEDAAHIWRVICIGELFTQLEPAVKDICGERLRRTFDCYRAALPEFTFELYTNAFAERRRVLRDWLGFFERYAVIVAPVGTEPPLSPDADIESPEATIAVFESYRMTVAINALGLPAAVVPVGLCDGLPQVVQIVGPPFKEMRCLAAAEAIEEQVEPLTPIDPLLLGSGQI